MQLGVTDLLGRGEEMGGRGGGGGGLLQLRTDNQDAEVENVPTEGIIERRKGDTSDWTDRTAEIEYR